MSKKTYLALFVTAENQVVSGRMKLEAGAPSSMQPQDCCLNLIGRDRWPQISYPAEANFTWVICWRPWSEPVKDLMLSRHMSL